MPSASSERREGSLRRRPPLRVVVAGQALAEAVGLGAGDGQMGHCGSASSLVRARHGDGMYGNSSPFLCYSCVAVMWVSEVIFVDTFCTHKHTHTM